MKIGIYTDLTETRIVAVVKPAWLAELRLLARIDGTTAGALIARSLAELVRNHDGGIETSA